MITRIEKVNGSWFAYTATGVLGPFKFYYQALRAVKEQGRENDD